jgi:hypothetical protein
VDCAAYQQGNLSHHVEIDTGKRHAWSKRPPALRLSLRSLPGRMANASAGADRSGRRQAGIVSRSS